MYIWLVCCCSIPRLIISFALNGSCCRSRLKNEVYMYTWLVCCGSIPRLIISFALNGSYCPSRLKNELYMYIWLVCCGSIRRLIISFALNGSYCRSRLKNEVYMYIWLVFCGSIRRFCRLIIYFALNGSYRRSRLKNELYMYIWLVCCCSIPPLIISFALNGSYCRSRLKNEVYMYIWLVCCGSIRRFIISFASNTWWAKKGSDLKCAKVRGTLSSRPDHFKRLAGLPRVCRTSLGRFQTVRKLLTLWASACACAGSDLKCAKVRGILSSRSDHFKRLAGLPRVCRTSLGRFEKPNSDLNNTTYIWTTQARCQSISKVWKRQLRSEKHK